MSNEEMVSSRKIDPNKETQSSIKSDAPTGALRLDSWKELATYLKRSLRTVRRWEQIEGLPVHRHLHYKKETVYAFADEIDTWLMSRANADSLVRGPSHPTSGASTENTGTSGRDAPPERPIVIAVLPLSNLSGEASQEWSSEALTEELISDLGQVSPEHLRVIAFTSVTHYKQTVKTIQQIGRELGADFIMEGGVRQYGRRVRVTARLIAVRNQAQVWAEHFEVQLPPLFALQQGISRELIGALCANLQIRPKQVPRPQSSPDIAAHDAYLLGIHNYGWSEENIKKGLDYFSRAVARDANFAAAYAELASAWFRLGFLYDYPPAAVLSVSREFALKAMTLDPGLYRVHVAMGAWNIVGGWNWVDAEASIRRAIQLNPSDSDARLLLAACHTILNRPDQGFEALREAQRVDPSSHVVYAALMILGYFARRYDMVIEICQTLLSPDPSSAIVHMVLGACFAQKGDYAQALSSCEKGRDLVESRHAIHTATLCSVYAVAGRRAQAERLLEELVVTTKQQYGRYIFPAQAAVGLGNNERTLEFLEMAFEQRDPLLVFLKADPRFEPLSGLPRFRNLLARIGLPS